MLSPLDALHAWAVLVNVTETSEMSDVPEMTRHDTTRQSTVNDGIHLKHQEETEAPPRKMETKTAAKAKG